MSGEAEEEYIRRYTSLLGITILTEVTSLNVCSRVYSVFGTRSILLRVSDRH